MDAPVPRNRISVTPRHEIELTPSYAAWLASPPAGDQIIRTLSRKLANGMPLIQGDLVIAGLDTRRSWPLAERYPVHFRKSYYPTCFHQDPAIEFRRHTRAAEILGIPPPIGSTRTTFRSCFIPGRPLRSLSPFGVEPPEANIAIARKADPLTLIGLWKLLAETLASVLRLHENGLAHGDLFLHNVIVSDSPATIHLIDFELAVDRDESDGADERWEAACRADLEEILREALYVQCGIGTQTGELARMAVASLPELTGTAAAQFERALDRSQTAW